MAGWHEDFEDEALPVELNESDDWYEGIEDEGIGEDEGVYPDEFYSDECYPDFYDDEIPW